MPDSRFQAHVDDLGAASEACPLVGSGRSGADLWPGKSEVMSARPRPANPNNTGFIVLHVMMTGKLACPMWGIPCPICRVFDDSGPHGGR